MSTTVDEAALRAELAEVMVGFRRDFAVAADHARPAIGPLRAALEAVNARQLR